MNQNLYQKILIVNYQKKLKTKLLNRFVLLSEIGFQYMLPIIRTFIEFKLISFHYINDSKILKSISKYWSFNRTLRMCSLRRS